MVNVYKFDISADSSYLNLVNYWPIRDSVFEDISGDKDPYACVNSAFSQDTLGTAFSAIKFSTGYCQLPTGFYFNYPNGFTIALSIKINKFYSASLGPLVSHIIYITITEI